VKEGLQQENVQQKIKEYEMMEDGLLMHKNIIYVPSSGELRNLVLKEMHNVPYARHPGYQKKNCSSKTPIILAKDEKRCFLLHFQMYGMLESEG
jgi:hypothetical protein